MVIVSAIPEKEMRTRYYSYATTHAIDQHSHFGRTPGAEGHVLDHKGNRHILPLNICVLYMYLATDGNTCKKIFIRQN